jgi:copper(I)-binding protein
MTNLAWRTVSYGLSAGLVLAVAQLSPAPAQAADYNVGSIHITQPWAGATPKGASTGAAYMTIANTGTAPDRVSCVSSDASAECQIHVMAMENGVMKMRPVADGLEIKPGETVTFKPSSLHLMLVKLEHPLDQGGTVKARLKFDNAGIVDVEYPIAAIGAIAPGAAENGSGTMTAQCTRPKGTKGLFGWRGNFFAARMFVIGEGWDRLCA